LVNKDFFRILFILAFPIFLLFSSLFFYLSYDHFYDHRIPAFEREKSDSIISFILSKSDSLPGEVSEKEKAHLVDVRTLIRQIMILYLISILIVMISVIILKRKLLKTLRDGAIASVSLVAAIFLASINFSLFFERFHHLFFDAGTWVFSRDDILIMIYPKEFFFDIFISILINTLILALIIFFFSVILKLLDETL